MPFFAQKWTSVEKTKPNKPNSNPISKKPKMVVILVRTMTNNNELRTTNYSKQSQSNPKRQHCRRVQYFLIVCSDKVIIFFMRIGLTKYGWPQVVIFPTLIVAAMAVCLAAGARYLSAWAVISVEAILAAVLIWVLSFFRDPYRLPPADKNILLAPADGRITDIEIVEDPPAFLQAPASPDAVRGCGRKQEGGGVTAMRIGIFLNIFNVHINRCPCNAKVERITYRPGKFKNAMNPQSGRVNESNDLALIRTDSPNDKLIVRQISGVIARRIVCGIKAGRELAGGEKFGMIKFGSRTELYVPAREDAKCLVKIGDKVKAGLTPLVRYEGTPLRGNQ
jgi:phosphatidylserine decarboxylase